MDKGFKSLIEEISNYVPERNKELFIEARAQQIIGSAVNFINYIKENYDPEISDDLSKRLVRSILSNDEDKFCRKIRALRKDKK